MNPTLPMEEMVVTVQRIPQRPQSAIPPPPLTAPTAQKLTTTDELASELKRRRKLEREQKALEAARAAAEAVEKERADAIDKARAEKRAALSLLVVVEYADRGDAPGILECLCEFEKELTPLAKQFGYRIVRVGDGNRATIVKL